MPQDIRSETAHNHVKGVCVLKARDEGGDERVASDCCKDITFVPNLFVMSLSPWFCDDWGYLRALLASV